MSVHDLKGRVALVTGAGTGIGQAVAKRLAANGAFVGIHFHQSRNGAEATLAAVKDLGGDGMLLPSNLSDPDEAARIVDLLVALTGRLDILFNNAGSPLNRSSIENCPLDLWQQVIATNLTSHFLVTQRAIPHLRITNHGSIINNLSLSVQTGGSNGAGPY